MYIYHTTCTCKCIILHVHVHVLCKCTCIILLLLFMKNLIYHVLGSSCYCYTFRQYCYNISVNEIKH